MDKVAIMQEIIANSYGTEGYHKVNPFSPVVVTDGILAVCQQLGAFWLVDAILSYRRREDFQVWTLDVKDGKAVLTMREDTNAPVKVKQKIGFTDFPEGSWKFWQEGEVLLLPSEH